MLNFVISDEYSLGSFYVSTKDPTEGGERRSGILKIFKMQIPQNEVMHFKN